MNLVGLLLLLQGDGSWRNLRWGGRPAQRLTDEQLCAGGSCGTGDKPLCYLLICDTALEQSGMATSVRPISSLNQGNYRNWKEERER